MESRRLKHLSKHKKINVGKLLKAQSNIYPNNPRIVIKTKTVKNRTNYEPTLGKRSVSVNCNRVVVLGKESEMTSKEPNERDKRERPVLLSFEIVQDDSSVFHCT